MAFKIVDLPQPEGPRKTTISPTPGLSAMSKDDVPHRFGPPPLAVEVGDEEVRDPQLGHRLARLVAVAGGLPALAGHGDGDGPRLARGGRDRGRLVLHTVSLQRKSSELIRRMTKSVRRPMTPITRRPANDQAAFWCVRASSTM